MPRDKMKCTHDLQEDMMNNDRDDLKHKLRFNRRRTEKVREHNSKLELSSTCIYEL